MVIHLVQKLVILYIHQTEYPSEVFISQHNELSYSNHRPRYLIFCCIKPSLTGGETPLADCRKILKQIPDKIKDEFSKKRIKIYPQS